MKSFQQLLAQIDNHLKEMNNLIDEKEEELTTLQRESHRYLKLRDALAAMMEEEANPPKES